MSWHPWRIIVTVWIFLNYLILFDLGEASMIPVK